MLAAALPHGEPVEREASLVLPPQPAHVRRARRFVRDEAPLAGDRLDVLVLLTSELVTNAVIHARTQVELTVAVTARSVLVMVHDLHAGPAPAPDEGREGGWGLGLVAALAAAAGTDRHPDGGKTAWFRLAR